MAAKLNFLFSVRVRSSWTDHRWLGVPVQAPNLLAALSDLSVWAAKHNHEISSVEVRSDTVELTEEEIKALAEGGIEGYRNMVVGHQVAATSLVAVHMGAEVGA